LKHNRPKLIVGSCKSIGEYALPCSIYIFKRHNKEVDINIEVINSTKVIEKLNDHSINIGIIQGDYVTEGNPIIEGELTQDGISTKEIISDEFVLVGSNYKGDETISIDELKKLPLFLREKTSHARHLLERALKEKGVPLEDLNVIYDLNSPEAIKSTIVAGKGFAFLPKLIISNELKKGSLKQINVEGIKIDFSYYIAFRKSYTFTEYEQMFVDFIISKKRGFC